MRFSASLLLLALACSPEAPAFTEQIDLDPLLTGQLAESVASELAKAPESLTMTAALGLARIGVRLEQDAWVQAADSAVATRLADPDPLVEEEAAAFALRYAELFREPELLARLRAHGFEATASDLGILATVDAALHTALATGRAEDFAALASAVGAFNGLSDAVGDHLELRERLYAWLGDLYLDAEQNLAVVLDELVVEQADAGEGGGRVWRLTDRSGLRHDIVVRRRGGHSTLRQLPPLGSIEIPLQLTR